MSSAAAFAFNSWVWVKQPDYPWWPAMVLDPVQAGQELPEGCDLVLLCGPNASATLAFASAADGEQVRAFQGAEADATLILDGRADESCAAAIDEMLAAAGADPAASAPADHATAAPAPSPGNGDNEGVDEDAVDLGGLLAVTEAATAPSSERKHKKEKKSKKEKTKSSSAKKTEREKSKRRRHEREQREAASGSSDSEENLSEVANEYDDSDHNDDLFRRRNGTVSSRTAAKKVRYERQSRLEEYGAGTEAVAPYRPLYDPTYLYRKVRHARRTATTPELMRYAADLRESMGRCLNGAATAAELEEDAVLRVLRQLTSVDVTVAQLQASGIGVAVGGLLRVFTPTVVQLARAILNYWFHSLPQNTQQQLAAETEIDRASVDTCASGDSAAKREGELRRLGVTLYDSFTNEEINDAPASADVVEICRLLEEALEQHCDGDAQKQVLLAFDKSASIGKSLRRLVLEGRITADDVVRHASDLPALIRSHERRPPNILTHTSNLSLSIGVGGGSPTSPNEVFSPSGEGATGSPTFGSPTGQTTTALYTCPHCGANDAYHSSYTVQAHDNMPDILRCKKCGMTWNVSDQ